MVPKQDSLSLVFPAAEGETELFSLSFWGQNQQKTEKKTSPVSGSSDSQGVIHNPLFFLSFSAASMFCCLRKMARLSGGRGVGASEFGLNGHERPRRAGKAEGIITLHVPLQRSL